MKIDEVKTIYFVGIKGVGMCSLAVYCKERDFKVFGSDVKEEFSTDKVLNLYKIEVKEGFKAGNLVKGIDLVITTGAWGGMTNVEVSEAKKLGIPVMTQAEALGLFMKEKRGITVCGVGGKTTVSSMLATVFKLSKLDPSYVVGVSEINPLGSGGRFGNGDYFIAEGDEYCSCSKTNRKPRFYYQNPEIAVLTNLEYDHPDIYKNFEQTKKTFLGFIKNIKSNGHLIINNDNKNNREFINVVKQNFVKLKIITYGKSIDSNFQIINIKKSRKGSIFDIKNGNVVIDNICLNVFGNQNVSNATGAVVVGKIAGISNKTIIQSLAKFRGVKRRFEFIGSKKGINVYDDYAHHPSEIKETIKMIRDNFSNSKIYIIFQPHTFSRTKSLLSDFAHSLREADFVYLIDIFPSAREKFDKSISSKDLVDFILNIGGRSEYFNDEEKLYEDIMNKAKKGDVIITMGAGDVYKLANKIINNI